MFSNISTATVNSDVVTYAPDNGIIQIQAMTEYDASDHSIRSFQNVTFDKIYGDYASVFLFDAEVSEDAALQEIVVYLNSSTIQNCYSNTHGVMYFKDSHEVSIHITDSTFSNNYGLNGPADMYVAESESLTIESTTFEGFTVSNSKGMSAIFVSL